MSNPTKLRREKAPKEGYNFLRFLENYTLKEMETLTLRQLLDLKEQSNIARREIQS